MAPPAERDTPFYNIVTTTNTSTELGETFYPTVHVDLTQDFNLQRVAKGLDSITLNVSYKNTSGDYIDPDGYQVNISIYDAWSRLILQDTETRTATGNFKYTYTPSASSQIGIYRAVHSATIGATAITTEDFFKVVSTNPGSYYGKVLRGEDLLTLTLSNEPSQQPDVGSKIYIQIKSPTGVVLVSTEAVNGTYTFMPTYNDPVGDYQVLFTYYVNGSGQVEQQYFTVANRREENLITADEFLNSVESFRYRSRIKAIGNQEIDNVLADAQAEASRYVGYPLGNKVVTGEKLHGSIDAVGFLHIRPLAKNLLKIIRCTLRIAAQVALTLPVSGFLYDVPSGMLKYTFGAGLYYRGSIIGLFNEFGWQPWYEVILDYETGFVNDEQISIKRAIRLIAMDIFENGFGFGDLKQVKSGNYTEEYYDRYRVGTKSPNGAVSMWQERAYQILDRFKRAPIV